MFIDYTENTQLISLCVTDDQHYKKASDLWKLQMHQKFRDKINITRGKNKNIQLLIPQRIYYIRVKKWCNKINITQKKDKNTIINLRFNVFINKILSGSVSLCS